MMKYTLISYNLLLLLSPRQEGLRSLGGSLESIYELYYLPKIPRYGKEVYIIIEFRTLTLQNRVVWFCKFFLYYYYCVYLFLPCCTKKKREEYYDGIKSGHYYYCIENTNILLIAHLLYTFNILLTIRKIRLMMKIT